MWGTLDFGVFYEKWDDPKMVDYTNNDYACDIDDYKSLWEVFFLWWVSELFDGLKKEAVYCDTFNYLSRVFGENNMLTKEFD